MAVFLRGLSIGALVGAAIAGSALWERARRRSEHEPKEIEPGLVEPEPGLVEPELTDTELPGPGGPPADG
jgi:predicted acylesterase/phospholipase RssA